MSSEVDPLARRAEIRAEMKAARQALSDEAQQQAAEALARQLLPLLSHASTIALYAAVRGEISLAPVAAALDARALCWPRVQENFGLSFHEATPSELLGGVYGIPEPPESPPVDPRALDAILVPGTAFSPAGGRLGMGGGYYDRFLPRLRADCLVIGVAYDWQLQDALPLQPHDTKMNHVVTDRQCLHCEMARSLSGSPPKI